MKAFEMKCYRRLLGVKLFHHVTNEEISQRVHLEEDVVTTIKRRKVQLFGHVCRMNDDRLLKIIMLGMVDGNNGRGRPRPAWIDDIREWTGMPLRHMTEIAHDREQWRAVVNIRT